MQSDDDEKLPIPFVRGSDTSKLAADSMEESVESLEVAVLARIRESQNGMTDDEVEVAMGVSHQTVSARRRTLVIKKMVVDSGVRRKTRSGRQAVVWCAVPDAFAGLVGQGSLDKRPRRPTLDEFTICLREIEELVNIGKDKGRIPPEALRQLYRWIRFLVGEG